MSTKTWGFIALLALGALKLPVEENVDQALLAAKLKEPIPAVGVWQ